MEDIILETLTNSEVLYKGQKYKVSAKIFSRGGIKSNSLILYYFEDRWITPFECKIRSIQPTFNGLFMQLYSHRIKDLIPQDFLLIKPLKEFSGNLYNIPIKLDLL